MQTMYWLILFVVLLIIEILTLGLTTIWFAGGALAAYFVGMLGVGVASQVVAFLAVSVVLLIFTRPIAVKYFNTERVRTNAESVIGRQGIVMEEIDTLQASGRVEVSGQEWAARTEDPDGKIAKGKVVVVERIQGVKLIVREREEE